MKTLTLLAGAGALALSAAAHAGEDAAQEDNTAHEAAASAPEPVERAYGEGARVNTAEGAPGMAGDEARPAHTGAASGFDDSDLAGTQVHPDSAEARMVREAMEDGKTLAEQRQEMRRSGDPELWGSDAERADVSLLQAFLAVDTDGDLLISADEFGQWQGDNVDAGAGFSEIDHDSSGAVGFAEYSVWTRLETGAGAEGPGS